MAQYSVPSINAGTQQNLSSSFKTIQVGTAATGATTLRRWWLYEFEIGATDVPNATDCPIIWDISAQTAAGTATTNTAIGIDQGIDAAALILYASNATAEGTITANSSCFYLGLNQRASQRWIARDQSSCIIGQALNLKGWAMRAKSPNYASTAATTWFVQE